MNLIPAVGIDEIAFGTTQVEIVELLGEPTSEQVLSDTEGYPTERCVLNYDTRSFLFTPNDGLISIGIELSDEPIVLWKEDISPLTPIELQTYMRTKRYIANIEKDGWGNCDIDVLEIGLLAFFTNEKLEWIELHNPSWRHSYKPKISI